MFVMFLPPNTTAIIQPMEQNIIQNIKFNCQKRLISNNVVGKKKKKEPTLGQI
jgi:hypothetical protein